MHHFPLVRGEWGAYPFWGLIPLNYSVDTLPEWVSFPLEPGPTP